MNLSIYLHHVRNPSVTGIHSRIANPTVFIFGEALNSSAQRTLQVQEGPTTATSINRNVILNFTSDAGNFRSISPVPSGQDDPSKIKQIPTTLFQIEQPLPLGLSITEPITSLSRKFRNLSRVCREKETSIVFIPCGHKLVCVKCSAGLSNCPRCNKSIKRFVETFAI